MNKETDESGREKPRVLLPRLVDVPFVPVQFVPQGSLVTEPRRTVVLVPASVEPARPAHRTQVRVVPDHRTVGRHPDDRTPVEQSAYIVKRAL